MFQAAVFFKGNINPRIIHTVPVGNLYHTISTTFAKKKYRYGLTQTANFIIGVIDTADHKISDFKIEFLGEIESTCKKAITVYQGPIWSCLMKKIEVKNLVTQSL
jgi:hypothetical protein